MSALVSIVLPTYNRATMLPGALESCLCQTARELELIVVDDGSTDETPAVVAEAAKRDPRVRYVRQENGRLPAALNTGHRAARGDYLTWTSDDNLYEPDAIEVMRGYLEEHPETGLVYCDMQKMGPEGEDLGLLERAEPEALADRNCVGGCFLYRREVYEAVGDYATDLFLAEDYDYWLRVSLRFPIAHLAGVAPYRFRTHPDSLTNRRMAEAFVQAARARCRHLVPPERRKQVMAEAHWTALNRYLRPGDLDAAWWHASEGLRFAPEKLRSWQAAFRFGTRLLLSRLRRRVSRGDEGVKG